MVEPPKFRDLDTVEAKRVMWLWKPYIPLGMITLLEGDPGVGKSYLALHLAATVSIGELFPEGVRSKRSKVLYLTTEDDPAYTLRPRLEAMKGDASKVRFNEGFIAFNEKGLSALRRELRRSAPLLVIVDTLHGFLPSGVDSASAADIRRILTDVSVLAAEFECAIVILRHWTKGDRGGKAIYRGSGSIDIIGVARSAITVGKHPQDAAQRVVAHVKHNLSSPGPSWVFDLQSAKEGAIPSLRWLGETTITADELQGVAADEPAVLDRAIEFLQSQLKEGPKAATEIQVAAEALSISKRTLDRAKRELGLKSQKVGSGWVWSLKAGSAPK